MIGLAQGVAKDFNPATCDCEPLDLIVTTALERADEYLKQAGPDHPVLQAMQNHAGDERALRERMDWLRGRHRAYLAVQLVRCSLTRRKHVQERQMRE